MDFTNINDPAGVSALLERLRSSQAWIDLQSQPVPPEPQARPSEPLPEDALSSINAETKPSVASLLSQLTSVPAPVSGPSFQTSTMQASTSDMSLSTSQPLSSSVPTPEKSTRDTRTFTLQQALPRLAELSDDPSFVDIISKLRRDQSNLEKQLWEERQALHTKQSEKVKIAVTKAKMLGTGISEREAKAMRQVFEDELKKFDRERVILAWDGLIARQQVALEKAGVPTMFMTDVGPDRERQQRVIQVLEGIVSGP